eukprot:4362575-Amphidinium_carterae.1
MDSTALAAAEVAPEGGLPVELTEAAQEALTPPVNVDLPHDAELASTDAAEATSEPQATELSDEATDAAAATSEPRPMELLSEEDANGA